MLFVLINLYKGETVHDIELLCTAGQEPERQPLNDLCFRVRSIEIVKNIFSRHDIFYNLPTAVEWFSSTSNGLGGSAKGANEKPATSQRVLMARIEAFLL